MNHRLPPLARLAALLCLLTPIALAGVGCAGVTAEDLEPHVATARDLAERNNAAIAIRCVGMPDEVRQALIRDNIDHAAQLGALQQSADDGPGWLSQVIAWALSFSRLAGIVAADPQIETPEQPAMDGNNTPEPETPAPDDDGDGAADGLEAARCCPGCGGAIGRHQSPAIMRGASWHLACARADYARQLVTLPRFR